MKILHLVHRSWPYHGGAERYVWEHARAAARWGHESTIFTTDAWDMSLFTGRRGRRLESLECVHEGVSIRRFRVEHPPLQNLVRAVCRRLMPCGRDRFFYPNPFVPSLHREMKRTREFDFVHANAMPFMLWEGFAYALRNGTGLASVPHGNLGEPFRRTEEIHYLEGCQPRILRSSSLVVAQSEFEASVYRETGVSPGRIMVLGSGIDPIEFDGADREAGRRSLGIDPKVPVVLSLTAHSVQKGSVDLLRACTELWESGSDLVLVLAGPRFGSFDKALGELSSRILPGRLVLTGMVSRENRADLIASADVFALPSRLDCFGIALLEAWACGLPVVGCWAGAMPEIISDGENGFLCGFGDQTTLAHRILCLLDSPGLRESMGARGRSTVLKRHTWDLVTDRFYRRIAGCLGSKGIR